MLSDNKLLINDLCMIFARVIHAIANTGSLTYTPLLGWEGVSEPKGRRSNRTMERGWEFAQAILGPSNELARAHQSDPMPRNQYQNLEGGIGEPYLL